MDCDHVHRCLVEGRLDEAARSHARSCPGCAELSAEEAALGRLLAEERGQPLDPALSRRVVATVAADAASFAGRPTSARVALWCGLSALFVALGAARPRGDLELLGLVWASTLAITLGSAVALVVLALRPLHRPELPRGVVLGAAWVGLALPLAVAAAPVSDAPTGSLASAATAACFAFGSLGVGSGVLCWWFLERRRHGGPWWLAVAAGAAWGHAALLLHCPFTDLGHTLASHGSLAWAWSAVGLLVTARGSRSPASPPRGA